MTTLNHLITNTNTNTINVDNTPVDIDDIRPATEFKGITFSNFKKTDVKKELLNSLINSKIEPACYWSAELICSGHYMDIWEIVILFYSKHIHLGNPKIANYIELRVDQFKDIANNGYKGCELILRNNTKIRHIFFEMMCVLCDAKRKHCFNNIKIKRDEMDITVIKDKFKAPSSDFIEDVIVKGDPKELFVAINELAYNISVKNIINACYWLEWIVEFDSICKKRGDAVKCERREFHLKLVESKYQLDIIWLIWDLLLIKASYESAILQKMMNALLKLFCLKYTASTSHKRKYLIYFAMALFCENITFEDKIIRDEQQEIVNNIILKKDLIFKQIKANEVSPNMGYLFMDVLKSRNLEKTIDKLDKMNTFGESFIPRITT
jgi:hypothetical protein